MTRDELIETMARAGIRAGIQSEQLSQCVATFMASAIEAAGLAIVPVEATEAMENAAEELGANGPQALDCWCAMIEAGRV